MTTNPNCRHVHKGWKYLMLLLPLIAAAGLLCGCSGGYSFTGASIPPGAKTISVKTFPNYAPTVNPQLSQKLSDDLRNMFSSQTSLNIANSDGDLQIEGEITGYSTRASSLSSNDEVAMNRLTITIQVSGGDCAGAVRGCVQQGCGELVTFSFWFLVSIYCFGVQAVKHRRTVVGEACRQSDCHDGGRCRKHSVSAYDGANGEFLGLR